MNKSIPIPVSHDVGNEVDPGPKFDYKVQIEDPKLLQLRAAEQQSIALIDDKLSDLVVLHKYCIVQGRAKKPAFATVAAKLKGTYTTSWIKNRYSKPKQLMPQINKLAAEVIIRRAVLTRWNHETHETEGYVSRKNGKRGFGPRVIKERVDRLMKKHKKSKRPLGIDLVRKYVAQSQATRAQRKTVVSFINELMFERARERSDYVEYTPSRPHQNPRG